MPYLDNNATTRPTPAVCEAVARACTELWHNPSSIHRQGQAVRNAIETAREDIAALLHTKPRNITFTATGTESIHLAIRGSLARKAHPVLLTTEIEHAAVRELTAQLVSASHAEIRHIPLLPGGLIDLPAVPPLLAGAHLCSVQWVNNETGVVQPIGALAGLCKHAGVLFHTDATQIVGRAPLPADIPADLLSCSAHKFHGPKGVGILYARPGLGLRPLFPGSQELGRRAGTENVPGILGAGVAAREAARWLEDESARTRLAALRDRLEAGVLAACPTAVINSPPRVDRLSEPMPPRLWTTTSIGFPHLEAEALLILLSEKGLAASAGAACSSGSLDPSPVLLAMGIPPPIAHGSIRLSLSRFTTEADIEAAIPIIAGAAGRLAGR